MTQHSKDVSSPENDMYMFNRIPVKPFYRYKQSYSTIHMDGKETRVILKRIKWQELVFLFFKTYCVTAVITVFSANGAEVFEHTWIQMEL